MKNQQLNVAIEGERLCISIGLDTLCFAAETGRSYGLEGIEITDKSVFVGELVNELKSEDEDGSTLIHRAIDEAVSNALENGAQGVRFEDE